VRDFLAQHDRRISDRLQVVAVGSIFAPPATVSAIDTDLEMKRLRRKESFTDRTISGFAPQFGAAT